MRRATRGRDVLLGVLAAIVFGLLCLRISAHAPYVGHFDEAKILSAGKRIVEEQTADPGFFNYPSLPIYLAATTMAGARGGRELPGVQGPRYEPVRPVLAVKVLFAALAAAGLFLTGLASLRVEERLEFAAIAMLAVFGTTLWNHLAWSYLNVDIVGTFFVSLVLYLIVKGSHPPAWVLRATLLGALCGLAVASKYPLGLILLPALVHLSLVRRRLDVRASIVLVLSCVLAFVVAVPHSVLSADAFLEDIRYEMEHYTRGHRGHEGSVGAAQLVWYLRYLVGQLGSGFAALAAVGTGTIIYRRRWELLPILLWIVLLVGYFSTKSVRFPRNIVAVFPAFAILITVGLGEASGWLTGLLARASRGPRRWHRAAAVVVLLTVLPWAQILRNGLPTEEPRRAAEAWLLEHAPPGSRIILGEDLGIPKESLASRFLLTTLERRQLVSLSTTELDREAFYVLPRYSARRTRGKKSRQALVGLTAALPPPIAQFEGRVIDLDDSRFNRRPRPAVDIISLEPKQSDSPADLGPGPVHRSPP